MIRKSIQITKEQNKKLKKKAFDENISESEVVRRALEYYYNKEVKE